MAIHDRNRADAAQDRDRAQLFTLVARLLDAAPRADLLAALASLPAGGTPIGQAVGGIAAAAARASEPALEREYAALFIGVARGELLPFASYYRTGFLHERPLADLRADLIRLGIARTPSIAEPEDHIAFLCDVMAGLLEGRFVGDPDAFFAAHLRPWAERFFTDLERAEAARFYRAVGTLGRTVIEIEQTAAELAA